MSDGNLLLKQNSVFGGDYGLSNYERPSETLARKFGTRLRNLDTENEHVFAGSPSRLLNTTDSPLHSHKESSQLKKKKCRVTLTDTIREDAHKKVFFGLTTKS